MMASRERWLAAVQMQPVDRLPFWPKLNGAYPKAQRPPVNKMSVPELHTWIGSDPHVGTGSCLREIRQRTSAEVQTSEGTQITIFHTLLGDMRLVKKFDEGSQSWHPVEFPVKGRDDIARMMLWYEDCEPELHLPALERAEAHATRIGQQAVTATTIGESPLMHWVEWLAGVANGHYLLADYREEVEGLFEAIHRVLLRRTEIIAEHHPADLLYFSENTSTTLISPDQYRTYCFRHIREYGEIAQSHERLMVLHMCGFLRDLLPDLAKLPVAAFEAFTSAPLANTSFADGRAACPETCLIGGTNAVLWTEPATEIIAQIERDLDALPHHRGLVITSAGVMPPLCTPETIREVCNWVKQFDCRFEVEA